MGKDHPVTENKKLGFFLLSICTNMLYFKKIYCRGCILYMQIYCNRCAFTEYISANFFIINMKRSLYIKMRNETEMTYIVYY